MKSPHHLWTALTIIGGLAAASPALASDRAASLMEQANAACHTPERIARLLGSEKDGEQVLQEILRLTPELRLDGEQIAAVQLTLCSPGFQDAYYDILKKERTWETKNLIIAIILGLLYGYAYMSTIQKISRRGMPIDMKSFVIFGTTSGAMAVLNGFVPGSLVYFESFCLALYSVHLHLQNEKNGIPYLDGTPSIQKGTGDISEEWLQREQLAFETFTDNLPWPAVRYNAEWFPIVWNKKMEEETGYSREEVRKYYQDRHATTPEKERPFIIMKLLYRGENLEKVEEYLARVHAWQWYTDAAFTMTTKSGDEKTFLWNTFPDGRSGNLRIARLLTDPVEIQTQLRKMEKLLREDPGTGAKNRRAFDEDTHTLLTSPIRAENQNMLVAIIDIDNFKQINDIQGHKAGDRILREVVTFIESHLRPGDELYRIGGDEFAVRLRGDMEGIYIRLNDIRQGFYEQSGIGTSWGLMPFDVSQLYNPTLTIAEATSKFEDFKETADKYMYAVKYYRLIESELVAAGKIETGQEPKNGIALPIYDQNGELLCIRVKNKYGEFTVSREELKLITDRTNPETVGRKKK